MDELTDAHLQAARRLLAQEMASSGDESVEAAVGRAYQLLSEQLAPVIGVVGVRALFARSVKLNRAKSPSLAGIRSAPDSGEEEPPLSMMVATALGALERGVALQSATDVYATFFALLTTFIGERLTWQIVQRAFKDDGTASKETT